jgi:hypothetical protein
VRSGSETGSALFSFLWPILVRDGVAQLSVGECGGTPTEVLVETQPPPNYLASRKGLLVSNAKWATFPTS